MVAANDETEAVFTYTRAVDTEFHIALGEAEAQLRLLHEIERKNEKFLVSPKSKIYLAFHVSSILFCPALLLIWKYLDRKENVPSGLIYIVALLFVSTISTIIIPLFAQRSAHVRYARALVEARRLERAMERVERELSERAEETKVYFRE